jgi:hypothetical protein
MKPLPPEQQAARFWAKVDKSAGPEGCWLYMGFRKWDGYGWLGRRIPGRKCGYITAHRYSWTLTHGTPAEGEHILHKCDNPPCCNPLHLRLGTHAENMRDMRLKGRGRGGKLTPEKVIEIRAALTAGEHRWGLMAELARQYGVTNGVIMKIKRRDIWRHI